MRPAAVVRTLYGVGLLIAPERAIRAVGAEPTTAGTVVGRLLGVRQIVQGLTLERVGGRRLLLLGAAADAAHVLTMVVVSLLSRTHRRLAAINAVAAGVWLLAGVLAARRD